MQRWVIGWLLLCAGQVGACMWDRDTLTMETKRFPNLAEVVVGKFERNPPRYYQMRLERVQAQLAQTPTEFELYDDAAVASDRLGDDDAAIAVMAAKRRAMGEHPAAEAQYRTLANLGTFHVHRWIHRGADRSDMSDLDRSVELLEAAIQLNPDAHFGRERYQLEAVKRLRTPPPPPSSTPADGAWPCLFGEAYGFPGHSGDQSPLAQSTADAKGITGLIVLGAAWESVDVYRGLLRALLIGNQARVAYLAQLRAEELARAGHPSLFPGAPTGSALVEAMAEPMLMLQAEDKARVAAAYRQMRAEADAWHASRTRFLEAGLAQGSHPDTDRRFWARWLPPATPTIDNPPPTSTNLSIDDALWRGLTVLGAALALLLLFLWWLFRLARLRAGDRD